MLLAIDVGNTNIVFGLFKGKKLVKTWRKKTRESGIGDWPARPGGSVKNKKIDGVIVASVVPKLNPVLRKKIKKSFELKPIFVTHKNIGLKIKLKSKGQVGADRLVDAYAALKIHGSPVIVVDFGTATTFCGVNKKGEYLGGVIAPGVLISRDALYEKTAKLPLVNFQFPRGIIGQSTVQAMLSGLYYGYVSMVEGMVWRIKNIIGKKAKVVATGGFAQMIRKKTKAFNVVDQNLTLKGLRMIWEDLNG